MREILFEKLCSCRDSNTRPPQKKEKAYQLGYEIEKKKKKELEIFEEVAHIEAKNRFTDEKERRREVIRRSARETKKRYKGVAEQTERKDG